MSGYTPLFDTLTKGTLCGRWPDIGLWPIVLSMSDKNGVIDATQHYIAGVTGLPVADVEACMKRFCEPDPYSRSQDAEGARLVLLDSHRDWGWQVVNHAKYKEKARLAGKNARDVESGVNAVRLRERRRPPETAADPLSDAYADSNTDADRREERASKARTARHLPEDFELTDERRKTATTENLDPDRTFAKFVNYWRSAGGQRARKRDWDAAWRYWCQNDRSGPKPNGSATERKPTRYEQLFGLEEVEIVDDAKG